MKILILGASSKYSIGFQAGKYLRSNGYSVIYASRSGTIGTRCDISDPRAVRSIVTKTRPDVVILAAGVFAAPKNVGNLSDWKRIANHIRAKSFGALIVANELVRVNSNVTFLVLGGREFSSHTGFAQFTIGNGALWSLVRFLNTNTKMAAYYLDLPFVTGSAMHRDYVRTTGDRVTGEITEKKIADVIARIIARRPKRKRIVLGKGSA